MFLADVQHYFGDDTTAEGIKTALTCYWKLKADLVRETADAGGDFKGLDLLKVQLERSQGSYVCLPHIPTLQVSLVSLPRVFKRNCIGFLATEIALCYGQGVKGKTMGVNFTRNIRPFAKLIREALSRGTDPGFIPIGTGQANSTSG